MSEPRATYNAVKAAGDATRREAGETRAAVNHILDTIRDANSPDKGQEFWRIVMLLTFERLHELFE